MLCGGMIYKKKLSSLGFFNAIDGTGLDAETAECAAPRIDSIISSIRDHGVFRADQMTVVTTDANG